MGRKHIVQVNFGPRPKPTTFAKEGFSYSGLKQLLNISGSLHSLLNISGLRRSCERNPLARPRWLRHRHLEFQGIGAAIKMMNGSCGVQG